jgi:hypothetical protein
MTDRTISTSNVWVYHKGYENALFDVTRALNLKLEEVRGMFDDALANRNTNDAYDYHLQAGGLCVALILVAELDDKARPTEEEQILKERVS